MTSRSDAVDFAGARQFFTGARRRHAFNRLTQLVLANTNSRYNAFGFFHIHITTKAISVHILYIMLYAADTRSLDIL